MTLEQAKKLHSGDEVFWNDPDNGACSRHYVINQIWFEEGDPGEEVVIIQEEDGSVLSCFAEELS